MLFSCDVAGDENAEMADLFMNRIDDGLTVAADFVDAIIKIEDPSESLLWRCDIVALRAKHDDRRTDVAQIDRRAVGRFDLPGGKIVADEKFIDDKLDFLGVQIDMAAPPALEAEISRRLCIDLGVEIVLFGP